MEKRLKSNEIDYLYAPLQKSNLQTFGNLVKSSRPTVKSTATAVVVKVDRGVYARIVVIAHHRQMNMQEVLTYPPEPGSIPLRNWNLLPIPIPIPELELNWNCHHWNWN